MTTEIFPTDRVIVFDGWLWSSQKKPANQCFLPATVVCRYGYKYKVPDNSGRIWTYEDCVDVIFDHRPERVSKGHFTSGVRKL
jgi:hypothetical protein